MEVWRTPGDRQRAEGVRDGSGGGGGDRGQERRLGRDTGGRGANGGLTAAMAVVIKVTYREEKHWTAGDQQGGEPASEAGCGRI